MTAGRTTISIAKHWCTPPSIIDSVKSVFDGRIGLDPCSNEHSLVQAERNFILPKHDGLEEDWDSDTIYVNPPYGFDKERGTRISHWFEKMAEAAGRGSEVICLVPVATNTGHWKKYVYPKAAAICFLYATRLRFYIDGVEDPKGAPMSCAVIYFGARLSDFAREFSSHGAVIPLAGISLPDAAASGTAPLELALQG